MPTIKNGGSRYSKDLMLGNNKTIYILGASGFIGSHLAGYFTSQGYRVITERIDITDPRSLKKAFGDGKPEVVINCAGVRAFPNIDWCENHKEETMRVNVSGAINAMTAAVEAGAYPIQIMSGCIYSGGPEKQFTEEDEPNFHRSFYSRMRIVFQEILKELPILQARIRMPISSYSHPRNLLNKLASYKQVVSVPNSATLLEDLAPALETLINKKITGILNLTNEGYVENAKLLELYKKIIDPNHEYKLISVDELEKNIVKAGRSNCVLSIAKAISMGVKMPALDEQRLEKIMLSYKKSLKK